MVNAKHMDQFGLFISSLAEQNFCNKSKLGSVDNSNNNNDHMSTKSLSSIPVLNLKEAMTSFW